MQYTVIITHEADPDVYVVSIPALDVVTQGDTRAGAEVAAQEAIALELAARYDTGQPLPEEPAGYAELILIEVPGPLMDHRGAVEAPNGARRS